MRTARARAALVAALWALAAGAVQAREFRIEDLGRIVRVADPQIAPDGKSIVIVVSRVDYEKDRSDSELVLVDVATGAQRVLTRDRPAVAHPRFSPAGDRLAFLAKAPLPKGKNEASAGPAGEPEGGCGPAEEPKFQIFVLPMGGGEAERVTAAPNGVQTFTWNPDGRSLAFTTADDPPNKEAIKKHEDAFEVGDNDLFASAAPAPTHIWLVPLAGGETRRLTSGSWGLPESAPPGPPASPPSWSPDGKSIAFTRQASPHQGDSDQTTIQILDVAGGAIRPLTGRKMLESFPLFSPGGGEIAYWYPREGDLNNVNEIDLAPVSTAAGSREPIPLTRAIDRCLYRQIWMPDGKSLLVGGNDRTQVSLWLQPLQGAARRLDLGRVSPSWLFWVEVAVGRKGEIAFPGSETGRPAELYYMAAPGAAPKRLTDFNHDIAGLDLARSERLTWKGPDGFEEDGVLLYPPGFAPGKRYPLVLHIHGGPQAASKEVFSDLDQLMAARGWVVFEPNYRGSDNLGNAYQRAIFNDAGDGPGRDVMAGLEAVKKRGFVDDARLAVTGWSYGGYMTSWMIGHYPGWKTAIAGAAVTDLVDSYSLSDFNVVGRWSFTGSPFTGDLAKAYRDQSPITSAANIKTPTLILSDTLDARVPITQSYKLYHALKDNGVPVSFVAYPVPGHFPEDPVRKRDLYRRWLEWLDKAFG
jgi:dipeptidyl aminopeptidase/acylaminoacyl peptidase